MGAEKRALDSSNAASTAGALAFAPADALALVSCGAPCFDPHVQPDTPARRIVARRRILPVLDNTDNTAMRA
jgi:hypothetical protein